MRVMGKKYRPPYDTRCDFEVFLQNTMDKIPGWVPDIIVALMPTVLGWIVAIIIFIPIYLIFFK